MSRNSTTGDPVKKFIILAIQEGTSSVHKGVQGQAASNTGSVSVTMRLKGKSSPIQTDVKSRMHFPNLKDLICHP